MLGGKIFSAGRQIIFKTSGHKLKNGLPLSCGHKGKYSEVIKSVHIEDQARAFLSKYHFDHYLVHCNNARRKKSKH